MFFVFLFVLVFRDRVSLYSPGCPGTLDFMTECVCMCVCVCVCVCVFDISAVIAVTCNLVGLCFISVIFFLILFYFYFLFYFILFYLFCFFFRDRVSPYSPGCSGTHFADHGHGGLEFRNPPIPASLGLGIKA